MIRTMDEMTAADYQAIGLRSGLEIHQQLKTDKKLFCRCPVLPYSDEYDARILRHMRPTLSELGEYDGTALMEFKTRKNIIYRINKETVCTYEIDDTPPFELNRQALQYALEITMLLNCKLVSEIHVQRKQYLDGSIPAGFQRTTILGVDGWVPYGNRRIHIIQLGLEEDACREVSDKGHQRVYLTDRLGIPLIETVTAPEMHTPREVADVAAILSRLARVSGKVRRGIGAARQDVNVSVTGGQRVEIKGVARIPDIPLLVHNEALRQVNLLEIVRELKARGIDDDSFSFSSMDVTHDLAGTSCEPVAGAMAEGGRVRLVSLKGYRGILSHLLQPGRTFADEISDRVRVIACLDGKPNILHNGGPGASESEWSALKDRSGSDDGDALILVWGPEGDMETAVTEIGIRAREALHGVCNETRQSFPDGTNGFERILPGPNRMYPDTDLAPLAIPDDMLENVSRSLPERPWERVERYVKAGIPEDSARRMSVSTVREVFDEAARASLYSPRVLSHFFLSTLSHIRKRRGHVPRELTMETLRRASEADLTIDSAAWVLEEACIRKDAEVEDIIRDLEIPEMTELESSIWREYDEIENDDLDTSVLERYLTGMTRKHFRDIPGGKEVLSIVRNVILTRGGETA